MRTSLTLLPTRGLMALACLLALPVLAGISCGGEGSAKVSAGGLPPTPVVVTALERREFTDEIEALGTVRARESVVVTARVTETVQRVNFEDGQVVAAGDVLVELTSAEESAQLEEARANFAEAKRQYRRVSGLYAQRAASRARLDERIAARDAASARLNELAARLSDRLIRAPFAGVLGLRSVSPGALVHPGDQITTLDDIEVVKVDFSVPETFFSAVQAGLTLRAKSAAWRDREFEGVVKAVDSRIDPRTRATRARAEIPNSDHLLRPGMLLTIVLRTNPREGLALPEQALVPRGSHQYVFVVDAKDSARRIEVTIGRRVPGFAEVLDGLDGTEDVIVDGAAELRPGASVQVVVPEAAADG